MAAYKRNDIPKIINAIQKGKACQVFLLIGDRFMCGEAADQLIAGLIPEQRSRKQNVKVIDGDHEDQLNTLNLFRTYNLFGGAQVLRVNNSKLFHSKAVAKKIWDLAKKAYENKKPAKALVYLQQMADTGDVRVDDLNDLSAAKWKSSFGFSRPAGQMTWLEKVYEKGDTKNDVSPFSSEETTDLYMKVLEDGVPQENILILLAETVDKRKKFYKFIVKHGAVIDLSVPSGSSKAAKDNQEAVLKDLIAKTLAEFDKKIEARATAALLERVGFHPVAIVRETEKLALFVGDAKVITFADLEAIVGRTKEEALYELTEAYSDKDIAKAITVSTRLIENGIHPLVLVAGVRNQIKKLMLVRSFRDSSLPVFVEGMTYAVFQKGYLPELKAEKESFLNQLPNHPYALFMMFGKVKKHSIKKLSEHLKELLLAEFRMKSSGISPVLIFENFLWKCLGP